MQETTLPVPGGTGSSEPGPRPGHRMPRRAGHGIGQRTGRRPATSDRPGWYRPALFALLAATAVLYLWDLSASGNANSFYAAAVQAGAKSWKAWFFGSLDSSNFITVDKPPGALWIMGLSARLFGYNSWSLLVPQALEGVAAVALLAATVRRVAGSAAGLLAGAVLALTPAAVLIFRFDNPDAFLVLLLVAAAYCVTRAIEHASMRWLTLAGLAIGFGFLTKSGQALLAVPAFGLAYLVAAPTSVRRRIGHLLVATLAMVVAAGWWIVAVLLVPAADRPYIGGSTDNNPLELAFGYNGLGRLLGGAGNGGGGGGGAAGGGNSGFGGATGLQRLFTGEMGLEISWLLPAALILLACGVWLTWRRPRTDPARASLIIWGGWLLITGGTFSYMKGTIHPYYTVALAPAIAAVIAIGGTALWRRRTEPRGAAVSAVLAVIVIVTCAWAVKLLGLASATAVAAIAVSVLAVLAIGWAALRSRTGRRLAAAAGLATAIAVAIPVTSWAVQTAGTPHTGSIPTAVATSGSAGSGPGGGGTAAGGRPSGTAPSGTKMGAGSGASSGTSQRPGGSSGSSSTAGQRPGGTSGSSSATGSRPAGGTVPGGSGTSEGGSGTSGSGTGTASGKMPTGMTAGGGGGAGGGTVSSALKTALEKTTTRWAAATIGSQSAATLELETGGTAVMAIGGFTGTDPAPTLAQFKAYVAAGDITYFIATGQGAGGGSSSVASQITSWVQAHYKSTTIGGQTVYVLTEG
jgi:4-amino-4-deoxy-L-arabinose transferase-like glycosyltransferase